jgi:hypothetical protein
MRSLLNGMRHGGARTTRAAVASRGTSVHRNFVIASALTSVIFLVGFVHAPVLPVIAGAALACAWALWRVSGS